MTPQKTEKKTPFARTLTTKNIEERKTSLHSNNTKSTPLISMKTRMSSVKPT